MNHEQFTGAAVAEFSKRPPDPLGPRQFRATSGDGYILEIPDAGVTFEVDRLRRERGELFAELAVRCDLPGAKTVDGTLSVANINLSSLRTRTERAKYLAGRARTKDVDWTGLVEEFSQRVLNAERAGEPAVDLRTLPAPKPDDSFDVAGLRLPRRHPSILFGDGGAAKSYLALYLAGRLAERDLSIGVFDWELAGEDHRDRLERLFPDGMPRIMYAKCDRPLVYEADRLARIVREHEIEYAMFDSVAFACDGPPEAAEVAGRYFRAVRQLGIGSLHIAHISKAEGGDRKPFGSSFWHNGARATWNAKLEESSPDGSRMTLGLFNRKNNLGRLQRPAGFQVTFDEFRTEFKRTSVADCANLAEHLTIRERMVHTLKHGAMDPAEIAAEIDSDEDTIKRTARRHRQIFTKLETGKLALLTRAI